MTFPLLSVPTHAGPRGTSFPATRSERLFPSSALASGLALAVYALAAQLVPHLVHPPDVIVVPLPEKTFEMVDAPEIQRRPGLAPPPPLERAAPAEPIADVALARPVPVHDQDVVPVPWNSTADERANETAPAAPGDAGSAAGAATPVDPYFIYHEVAPVLLHAPKPDYPELAEQAGVDGTVLVRAFVGVDGRVTRAELLKSVPLLDAAALDTALRMRFRPAEVSGRPVAVWVSVPIRFTLR